MGAFQNGYALLIGGSEAAALADTLRDTSFGGYPAGNIHLLQDENATAGTVQSALARLAGRTGRDSTVFIYHAGRPSREFVEQLQRIPARNLLLVLDWAGEGGLDGEFYDQLARDNGRAVITSARPGEPAARWAEGPGSLFAHHLEQALRGGVETAGDGAIGLFDLADYLSHHVPHDNPEQHPLLVARPGEANFPVALYRGGWQELPTLESKSLGPVRVQNTLGEALEPPEQALLESMFADYDRVVLKERFGGGWSGGRVYLVRPVQGKWAELPAVLKMGQEPLIRQEWMAYERFAQNRVPNVARMDRQPVFVPARPLRWGGLRYELAGNGQFYTESLSKYCQHATTTDIDYVLRDQLFQSLDTLWRKAEPRDEFPTGRSLDAVLPPNLTLEYVPQAADAEELKPQSGQIHSKKDELTLSGLVVTEVDVVQGELTLDLPAGELDNPGGYRVRVQGVPDLDSYQEKQLLPQPITGRVVKTRETTLRTLLAELFPAMAVDGEQVNIPGVGTLPNPLVRLPAVLRQMDDVRVGPVHGDLNLENVLVEFDHHNTSIHLIDFARAREDWVLHDLLRLETNLWTYFVAAEMERNGRTLADVPAFFAALRGEPAGQIPAGLQKVAMVLDTVRQKVQEFLTTTPQAWDVYWRGLLVYMLGALKFGNLGTLSKQVAFVVAGLCVDGGRVQQVMWPRVVTPAPAVEAMPPVVVPEPAELPTPPPPSLGKLLGELRTLLRHTAQFKSNNYLEAFFSIHEDLSLWANQLPQANNLQTRVDETVALLRERRDHNGRHALVMLVECLAEEYDERDGLHGQLKGMAGRLAEVLG